MTTLWLDLETYNGTTPISAGTHRYAEDAEILLMAYAIDDGPVQVVDMTAGAKAPRELQAALADPKVKIWAHNSHFDRTILKRALPELVGDPSRWRDTMVQALAHGLPGSLSELCDILRIPQDKAKDKEARGLMLTFSKPDFKGRRFTSLTNPHEWAKFLNYARLDVEAMRAVHKALPRWNYAGAELELWHLDQRINDRGVQIDVHLVEACVEAVGAAQAGLALRTAEITNGSVQAATQRDALLAYALQEYGVGLPDLTASTIERRLQDPGLDEGLRELLRIRQQAATSSTAKYTALALSVSADGRLRGTLQFCGASRTGRWSGRLFQPQNLPRPSLPQGEIVMGIQALLAGGAELIFDDIMELASSALRGAIIAPHGRKLVVADLSNIEGRVAAWLAGASFALGFTLEAPCFTSLGLAIAAAAFLGLFLVVFGPILAAAFRVRCGLGFTVARVVFGLCHVYSPFVAPNTAHIDAVCMWVLATLNSRPAPANSGDAPLSRLSSLQRLINAADSDFSFATRSSPLGLNLKRTASAASSVIDTVAPWILPPVFNTTWPILTPS